MCVFCEIAAGQLAAHIVYEDEQCLAFLDADPIQEGHVLLIPRRHYQDADEISEPEFAHLMCVSRKLIGAIKKACSPDGYSVMQNGGKFNDIGHYHMHIFPRYISDGFGWREPSGQPRADEHIAERIKSSLRE